MGDIVLCVGLLRLILCENPENRDGYEQGMKHYRNFRLFGGLQGNDVVK